MHSIETFGILLSQLIAALKGNVDGRLRSLGIKGIRSNPESCPLANYFKGKLALPQGWKIKVETTRVVIEDQHQARIHTFELPGEFTRFIKDFDGGKYPELEQELATV